MAAPETPRETPQMSPKTLFLAAAAFAASAAAIPASAAPTASDPAQQARPVPLRAEIMFNLIDQNGDGAIDATEMASLQKAIFGALDANKDGKLTQDEFRKVADGFMGRPGGMGRGPGARGFNMQRPGFHRGPGDHRQGQLDDQQGPGGPQLGQNDEGQGMGPDGMGRRATSPASTRTATASSRRTNSPPACRASPVRRYRSRQRVVAA